MLVTKVSSLCEYYGGHCPFFQKLEPFPSSGISGKGFYSVGPLEGASIDLLTTKEQYVLRCHQLS